MIGYTAFGNSRMNGIGWYSQINNQRLVSALSKTNNRRSVQGVSAADGLRARLLNADSAEFLKSYQSKMTDMMSKANKLREMNSQNVLGEMSIRSSEPAKLEVKQKASVRSPEQLEVDIRQLASEQMNFTDPFDAKGNDPMSGQLQIQLNDHSAPIVIDVDTITGSNNGAKLQKIANQVNRYRAGVSAEVVDTDGKQMLALYSDETGRENAFSVSGSFAKQTGLAQPEQEALDALYTVRKAGSGEKAQQFTSSKNDVKIGSQRIDATLKDLGKSTVTAGTDTQKTADAVQDLVNSYNRTLAFLNNNTYRGSGVLAQQRQISRSPIPEHSMKTLGITRSYNGSLQFDRETFERAAEEQPRLTSSLLSGSNGFADSIYDDAKNGMNVPSSSLTGLGTSTVSSSAQNYMTNYLTNYMQSFSTNGIYNRSGLLNLLNLNSAGVLMSFYG